MKGRDCISIRDFSKADIGSILKKSAQFKKTPPKGLLQGCLLGSCFFEPSTRTRLSFEAAIKRLGGEVVGFADGGETSAKKRESLHDAMKVISHYVDLIVLRHPLDGSARQAAQAADVPVINGGDGTNEHPTQTLTDLFSIQECQHTLEGLSIAIVGDLKYGRTAHSLVCGLKEFSPRLYFVSPPSLAMPEEICNELRKAGVLFSFHKTIEEVIEKVDLIYMTRIQEERFQDRFEYESMKNSFVLDLPLLSRAKSHLKVFHPLPRVTEIAPAVDHSPYAYYFEQAKNGVFVRQALISLLLGRTEVNDE